MSIPLPFQERNTHPTSQIQTPHTDHNDIFRNNDSGRLNIDGEDGSENDDAASGMTLDDSMDHSYFTSNSNSSSNYLADASSNQFSFLNVNSEQCFDQNHAPRQGDCGRGAQPTYQELNGSAVNLGNYTDFISRGLNGFMNQNGMNQFEPFGSSHFQMNLDSNPNPVYFESSDRSTLNRAPDSYQDLGEGGNRSSQWNFQEEQQHHLEQGPATADATSLPISSSTESKPKAQKESFLSKDLAATTSKVPTKKRASRKRKKSQNYFQEGHLTLERELGKGADYGALGQLPPTFYSNGESSISSLEASGLMGARRPSISRAGTTIPHFSLPQTFEDRDFSATPSPGPLPGYNFTTHPSSTSISNSIQPQSSYSNQSWSSQIAIGMGPMKVSGEKDGVVFNGTGSTNLSYDDTHLLRPDMDLEDFDMSSSSAAMSRGSSFQSEPESREASKDQASESRQSSNAPAVPSTEELFHSIGPDMDIFELQMKMMKAYQSESSNAGIQNYGSYVPYAPPVMARAFSMDSRCFPRNVSQQAGSGTDGGAGGSTLPPRIGYNRSESMPPPQHWDQEKKTLGNLGSAGNKDQETCDSLANLNSGVSLNPFSLPFDPLPSPSATESSAPASNASGGDSMMVESSAESSKDQNLRFTSTCSLTSKPINISSRAAGSYNQKSRDSQLEEEYSGRRASAVSVGDSNPLASAAISKFIGSLSSNDSGGSRSMRSTSCNPPTSVQSSFLRDSSMTSPESDAEVASKSTQSQPPPRHSTPPTGRRGSSRTYQLKEDHMEQSTQQTSSRGRSTQTKRKRPPTSTPIEDATPSDDEDEEKDNRNQQSGKWSAAEDKHLFDLVNQYGPEAMSTIARKLSTSRSVKQCRTRWTENLDPSISKAPFSDLEDRRIVELFLKFGAKWMDFSKELISRPPQRLKDRWRGALCKNLPLLRQVRSKVESYLERALELGAVEFEWRDIRINWERESWDTEPAQIHEEMVKAALIEETKSMRTERKRLEKLEAEQLASPVVWTGAGSETFQGPAQKKKRVAKVTSESLQPAEQPASFPPQVALPQTSSLQGQPAIPSSSSNLGAPMDTRNSSYNPQPAYEHEEDRMTALNFAKKTGHLPPTQRDARSASPSQLPSVYRSVAVASSQFTASPVSSSSTTSSSILQNSLLSTLSSSVSRYPISTIKFDPQQLAQWSSHNPKARRLLKVKEKRPNRASGSALGTPRLAPTLAELRRASPQPSVSGGVRPSIFAAPRSLSVDSGNFRDQVSL